MSGIYAQGASSQTTNTVTASVTNNIVNTKRYNPQYRSFICPDTTGSGSSWGKKRNKSKSIQGYPCKKDF